MKIRLRSVAFVAAILVSTVAAAFMMGPAAPTSTDGQLTTSVTSGEQGVVAGNDSVAVLAAEAAIGAPTPGNLGIIPSTERGGKRTTDPLDHSTIIPVVNPGRPVRRMDSIAIPQPSL